MKTQTFISKDGLMVATLILVKNLDENIYEGFLKYNNIYSNQKVDTYCSSTDSNNVDELYEEAKIYCNSFIDTNNHLDEFGNIVQEQIHANLVSY